MSSGHIWKSPELDKCELCGDKDWFADKYCSKNPEVAELYEQWISELQKENTMESEQSNIGQ